MIAFDDPRLTTGFHDPAPDHRWTAARARLPAELWQGLTGEIVLSIALFAPALPRWTAPASRPARPPRRRKKLVPKRA